jgi:hypothetical protein
MYVFTVLVSGKYMAKKRVPNDPWTTVVTGLTSFKKKTFI